MSDLQENTVQHTLCILLYGRMVAAEKYPNLFMLTFDVYNALGLKGANAEVKLAGNKTRLDHSQ